MQNLMRPIDVAVQKTSYFYLCVVQSPTCPELSPALDVSEEPYNVLHAYEILGGH